MLKTLIGQLQHATSMLPVLICYSLLKAFIHNAILKVFLMHSFACNVPYNYL